MSLLFGVCLFNVSTFQIRCKNTAFYSYMQEPAHFFVHLPALFFYSGDIYDSFTTFSALFYDTFSTSQLCFFRIFFAHFKKKQYLCTRFGAYSQ